MATSSSDDSSGSAPTDFRIYSSLNDSNGAVSVAVERCPLCFARHGPFTCPTCISEGDFVHSKQGLISASSDNENYCDKSERLKRANNVLKENICEFGKGTAIRNRILQKKYEISNKRDKIQFLKKAAEDAKSAVERDKEILKTTQEECISNCNRARKHVDKMKRICKYINQTQCHTAKQQATLLRRCNELQEVRKDFIKLLIQYIFPITEVKPKTDTDPMEMSTVSALAEARRTSYIQGRWIYIDNGSEQKYRIVEPTLNGNGDYSAYNLWLAVNRDSVPSSSDESEEISQTNPADTISAALSYITQLSLVLSYCLDVPLPKKLCYGYFGTDLSAQKFNKPVCKLNQNILHLCFSQQVDSELLDGKHTIHNILVMFQSVNLGRTGPIDVDENLLQNLINESHLNDQDSDSSDDEGMEPVDWETVSSDIPEMEIPTHQHSGSYGSSVVSHAYSSRYLTDTTVSTAGNIMSTAAASVASMWRAATGQSEK